LKTKTVSNETNLKKNNNHSAVSSVFTHWQIGWTERTLNHLSALLTGIFRDNSPFFRMHLPSVRKIIEMSQ